MRTPIARRQFDTNPKCDICGKQRSIRVHEKCSKIRQQKTLNTDTLHAPQNNRE